MYNSVDTVFGGYEFLVPFGINIQVSGSFRNRAMTVRKNILQFRKLKPIFDSEN